MRHFFITWFEKLITILVVIMIAGVAIGGLVTMFSDGGFFAGLFVWLVGAVYVIFMAGAMYLALGIYDNTRRTAEATEALLNRP